MYLLLVLFVIFTGVGSIGVVVSFPFIFANPAALTTGTPWLQMLYFGLFISVFQVSWAIVQISHLSLLPELTSLTEERAQLTAQRCISLQLVQYFLYSFQYLNTSKFNIMLAVVRQRKE